MWFNALPTYAQVLFVFGCFSIGIVILSLILYFVYSLCDIIPRKIEEIADREISRAFHGNLSDSYYSERLSYLPKMYEDYKKYSMQCFRNKRER